MGGLDQVDFRHQTEAENTREEVSTERCIMNHFKGVKLFLCSSPSGVSRGLTMILSDLPPIEETEGFAFPLELGYS